jgi:hypothetical protein
LVQVDTVAQQLCEQRERSAALHTPYISATPAAHAVTRPFRAAQVAPTGQRLVGA